MVPSENAWGDLFDDPGGYWEHEAATARCIARTAMDREVQSLMFEVAMEYDRLAIQSRKRSSGLWSTGWSACMRWWVRFMAG